MLTKPVHVKTITLNLLLFLAALAAADPTNPDEKEASAYCPPYVCPYPFKCYQRISDGFMENYCSPVRE